MLREEVQLKKGRNSTQLPIKWRQGQNNKQAHKGQIIVKGEKERELSWEEKEYRIKREAQRFLEVPTSSMVEKDQRQVLSFFKLIGYKAEKLIATIIPDIM